MFSGIQYRPTLLKFPFTVHFWGLSVKHWPSILTNTYNQSEYYVSLFESHWIVYNSFETCFASGTFRHCSGLSCFAFRTEFYLMQNIKCRFLGRGEVSKLYKFQCSYKKHRSRTCLSTTSEWFPHIRHILEQLAEETNWKKSLPHDDSYCLAADIVVIHLVKCTYWGMAPFF